MKKNIIILVSFLVISTVYLHADLTVNIPFDPNVTGPAYNDSNYTYTSEYFDVINNGETDNFTVNVNYYEIPSQWSLGWCHLYQGTGSCHVIPWPWPFEFGSGDTLKLDFNVIVTSAGSADFYYKFTAPSLADSVVLNFLYTTGFSVDDPQINDPIQITNSPNPFSESTTISFASPKGYRSYDELSIYNIKGEIVRTFSITPEMKSILWNGTDQNGQLVLNGVYFYSVLSENEIINTEKLLLLR